MKVKKRTAHENYVNLLLMMAKKRHTPFKFNAFVKAVQPFCKTTRRKDKLLFLRIRGSKNGLRIEIMNDNYFIINDRSQNFEFHLFCETSKELLDKLIYHKLLIP